MCGGEDVFGVGGELDVLADGVVSFCEGFEALAVNDAPYAAVIGVVFMKRRGREGGRERTLVRRGRMIRSESRRG